MENFIMDDKINKNNLDIRIKERYFNDNPNGNDYLDMEIYADALLEIIKDQNSMNIGIYGEWGQGKSFLFNILKDRLEISEEEKERMYIEKSICCCENNLTRCIFSCFRNNFELDNNNENDIEMGCCDSFKKCCYNIGKIKDNDGTFLKCFKQSINGCCQSESENIIIEFNAWIFEGSDNLWAGLIETIHETMEERFGWLRTRWFRFFEYEHPTLSEKLRWSFSYIIFIGIPVMIGFILLEILDIYGYDTAGMISLLVGTGGTASILLLKSLNMIKELAFSQANVLKKKAYQTDLELGFMNEVKKEMEIVSEFLRYNNKRIIIFIDDLDRCNYKKAVDVLNAVKLLLSENDSRYITFFAIDPRIVIKAIESTYDKTLLEAGINGYEFLDKIIQIPFVLGKSNLERKNVKNYIKNLLEDDYNSQILNLLDEFINNFFLTNDICNNLKLNIINRVIKNITGDLIGIEKSYHYIIANEKTTRIGINHFEIPKDLATLDCKFNEDIKKYFLFQKEFCKSILVLKKNTLFNHEIYFEDNDKNIIKILKNSQSFSEEEMDLFILNLFFIQNEIEKIKSQKGSVNKIIKIFKDFYDCIIKKIFMIRLDKTKIKKKFIEITNIHDNLIVNNFLNSVMIEDYSLEHFDYESKYKNICLSVINFLKNASMEDLHKFIPYKMTLITIDNHEFYNNFIENYILKINNHKIKYFPKIQLKTQDLFFDFFLPAKQFDEILIDYFKNDKTINLEQPVDYFLNYENEMDLDEIKNMNSMNIEKKKIDQSKQFNLNREIELKEIRCVSDSNFKEYSSIESPIRKNEFIKNVKSLINFDYHSFGDQRKANKLKKIKTDLDDINNPTFGNYNTNKFRMMIINDSTIKLNINDEILLNYKKNNENLEKLFIFSHLCNNSPTFRLNNIYKKYITTLVDFRNNSTSTNGLKINKIPLKNWCSLKKTYERKCLDMILEENNERFLELLSSESKDDIYHHTLMKKTFIYLNDEKTKINHKSNSDAIINEIDISNNEKFMNLNVKRNIFENTIKILAKYDDFTFNKNRDYVIVGKDLKQRIQIDEPMYRTEDNRTNRQDSLLNFDLKKKNIFSKNRSVVVENTKKIKLNSTMKFLDMLSSDKLKEKNFVYSFLLKNPLDISNEILNLKINHRSLLMIFIHNDNIITSLLESFEKKNAIRNLKEDEINRIKIFEEIVKFRTSKKLYLLKKNINDNKIKLDEEKLNSISLKYIMKKREIDIKIQNINDNICDLEKTLFKNIKNGFNTKNIINYQDENGNTILHYCIYFNKTEWLKKLLECGGNDRLKNKNNKICYQIDEYDYDQFINKIENFSLWSNYDKKKINIKKINKDISLLAINLFKYLESLNRIVDNYEKERLKNSLSKDFFKMIVLKDLIVNEGWGFETNYYYLETILGMKNKNYNKYYQIKKRSKYPLKVLYNCMNIFYHYLLEFNENNLKKLKVEDDGIFQNAIYEICLRDDMNLFSSDLKLINSNIKLQREFLQMLDKIYIENQNQIRQNIQIDTEDINRFKKFLIEYRQDSDGNICGESRYKYLLDSYLFLLVTRDSINFEKNLLYYPLANENIINYFIENLKLNDAMMITQELLFVNRGDNNELINDIFKDLYLAYFKLNNLKTENRENNVVDDDYINKSFNDFKSGDKIFDIEKLMIQIDIEDYNIESIYNVIKTYPYYNFFVEFKFLILSLYKNNFTNKELDKSRNIYNDWKQINKYYYLHKESNKILLYCNPNYGTKVLSLRNIVMNDKLLNIFSENIYGYKYNYLCKMLKFQDFMWVEITKDDNNKNLKNMLKMNMTKDELDYIYLNLDYLKVNPRKIKRIINLVSLSRFIFDRQLSRSEIYYKIPKRDIYRLIIKFTILFEQWSYRSIFVLIWVNICWENRDMISNNILENEDKIKIWIPKNLRLDIKNYKNNHFGLKKNLIESYLKDKKLIDFYFLIEDILLKTKKLKELSKIDYEPNLFIKFLQKDDLKILDLNAYQMLITNDININSNPAIYSTCIHEINEIQNIMKHNTNIVRKCNLLMDKYFRNGLNVNLDVHNLSEEAKKDSGLFLNSNDYSNNKLLKQDSIFENSEIDNNELKNDDIDLNLNTEESIFNNIECTNKEMKLKISTIVSTD